MKAKKPINNAPDPQMILTSDHREIAISLIEGCTGTMTTLRYDLMSNEDLQLLAIGVCGHDPAVVGEEMRKVKKFS